MGGEVVEGGRYARTESALASPLPQLIVEGASKMQLLGPQSPEARSGGQQFDSFSCCILRSVGGWLRSVAGAVRSFVRSSPVGYADRPRVYPTTRYGVADRPTDRPRVYTVYSGSLCSLSLSFSP